jgi:hypothetical protein
MCGVLWVLVALAVLSSAADFDSIELNPYSFCLSTTSSSLASTDATPTTAAPTAAATTAPDGAGDGQRAPQAPRQAVDWPCNSTADLDQFLGTPFVPTCAQVRR